MTMLRFSSAPQQRHLDVLSAYMDTLRSSQALPSEFKHGYLILEIFQIRALIVVTQCVGMDMN
jgi:hypothetical protein